MSRAGGASIWRRRVPVAVGWALLAVQMVFLVTALALGAHEPLFFGSGERGGQGVDFFCVPKAYSNLLAGRSAFDTWSAPSYGPHATWFVLHPAVAVWVGGYLWFLPPWLAYASWVAVTIGLLVASAALISRHALTAWRRMLVFAVLLASPLTYRLLYVGNVHAIVLLATTLVLVGLHELAAKASPALGISPRWKLGLGLGLSLLSKPVVLLVLPALVFVRATRRPALAALGVYALLSATFVFLPTLNPESVGPERLAWLVAHPGFAQRELNVYAHGFVLVPDMLDNGMHWLHMLTQSGYSWNHVELFSLRALLSEVKAIPSSALNLCALLPLLLSLVLLRMPSQNAQLRAVGWIVLAALAAHFLGYSLVWEYQYTQLLVAAAALLALPLVIEARPRAAELLAFGLLLLFVPTPYGWFRSGGLSTWELAVMRLFRIVPATLLALASVVAVVATARAKIRPGETTTRSETPCDA